MVTINAHIGRELYTMKITARMNSIIADEPESLGGKSRGLSPFELLASALGACTCATLRMYADRKGWDLADVKTEVSFERDYKVNKSTMIRNIELIGNLDRTQRERLLEIAESCPVHKTLAGSTEIETIAF